jgi:phosphoribosylanthranilate isomerase
MTWVKICGITNLEDALVAVDAGADAVGFVFYEKSPRKVDVQTVREIISKLPERLEKVGVFVDQSVEQVKETAKQAGLTAAQLHGGRLAKEVWSDSRPASECIGVSKMIPVIPAGSLDNGGIFISQEAHASVFALLIDAPKNGLPGGTGEKFDWQNARGMVESLGLMVPVIVAGGLKPDNVGEALNLFRPFGVDVSSGVEAKPGKKDPDKVRAFVRTVRTAEKRA